MTKPRFTYSSVLSSQVCSKELPDLYPITMRKPSLFGGKIIRSSSRASSLLNGSISRTSTTNTLMDFTTWKIKMSSSQKTAIFSTLKPHMKCLKSLKDVHSKDIYLMILKKWMTGKKITPEKCTNTSCINSSNRLSITTSITKQ